MQLCRQAHEALGQALASSLDDVLEDVWISAVMPAPDGARLAVVVCAPAGISAALVEERLSRFAARLRAEVAAAIVRKRAPTLVFEVWPEEAQP
jgi:ribosome-binding factor A